MTHKMWVKGTFILLKIVLIIQIFNVEEVTGIYSEPQRPTFVRKTRNLDKASIIPQFYKYLKGYYQKKGLSNLGNEDAPRFPGSSRKIRSGSGSNNQHHSLNNPKQYGRGPIQPKAGLSAGQYTFAQSREYLRKLRRLADLLKARVAARARQQPKQQPQPRPPPPPPPKHIPVAQPPPQPSYPAPQQQTVYRAPPQPIQSQPPQPQPQPQPRRTYVVQRPSQPQPTYNQVAPKVESLPLQNVVPKQASASISYQSLGLPQSGGYRILPQPKVTAAPAPAKPSIKTEALVKLLKASYSSLLPLLLNQAKMTSYGVQTIPLYGSNPYRVFGPMTYGPLPKPSSSQMKLTYSPQSFSARPTHPFSSGGYSSYNSGYGTGAVQVQSGTASGGYDSGTGSSSYGRSSGGSSYGDSGNSGYELSADVTCGPISGAFCHGRAAGHYSHPASTHCFVQCDHVGSGHPKGCSPGTTWKALGPEPALFNYCS